jgi:hypothetical protein
MQTNIQEESDEFRLPTKQVSFLFCFLILWFLIYMIIIVLWVYFNYWKILKIVAIIRIVWIDLWQFS